MYVQQQLCNDIPAAGGKQPINPDNASFDGITSGSGNSTNVGTDGHPKRYQTVYNTYIFKKIS